MAFLWIFAFVALPFGFATLCGASGSGETLMNVQENEDTQSANADVIEDASLSVPALIAKYGYPVEVHNVVTRDGYILEMHRIPYSPHNTTAVRRQPKTNTSVHRNNQDCLIWQYFGSPKQSRLSHLAVFLMHGILDSSGTWVIMGPAKGLAYLLADCGYDVWMGNARGNRYSRQHKTLNPDGQSFWNFSYEEIGIRDLPAMLDYILSQTQYEKLQYIGHSQGSTTFFVMASQVPAYNDKILSMQALAPVAFLSHLKSPLVRAASYLPLNTATTATEIFGSSPYSKLFVGAGQFVCRDGVWSQSICANFISLIAGYDPPQTNKTMIPVIFGNLPAGASAKQINHFIQGIRSGRFCRYDMGLASNLFRYFSFFPPSYDLTKITAPVTLHYSANDWISALVDVEQLLQKLPNVVGELAPEQFNHADFVWAIDVRTLLYDRVCEILRSHDGPTNQI